MTPDEANDALELLREVVSQARDDTTLQNWGVIWILHAFTNGGGFVATQLMLWQGVTSRLPFALMWTCVLTANILSIFLLKSKTAGARTFLETQIWVIWLSYASAVGLTGLVNTIGPYEVLELGPIIGVLTAFAFAMMGGVMGRGWFVLSALFVGVTLAMALVPGFQFIILGVTLGTCQLIAGVRMHLDKRRRGQQGPVLV